MKPLTDLGLYSITFTNDIEADHVSLEAFKDFREDAEANGFSYFLEVFNPNVERGLTPETMPQFVNDAIVRCLAGLTEAERPKFLKIAYNGPRALEELASFDPSLVVGVLGGGAGTTRDCFELIHQAEKYGARVALFGRKINLAESPLDIVRLMRSVADGGVVPLEAVKEYHGALQKKGLKPAREIGSIARSRNPSQVGVTMGKRRGVLSAGTWCVDFNKSIARWPEEDTSNEVLAIDRQNGGSGSNMALDLKRLDPDFPVEAMGVVGDDDLGRFLFDECDARG